MKDKARKYIATALTIMSFAGLFGIFVFDPESKYGMMGIAGSLAMSCVCGIINALMDDSHDCSGN